MPRRAVRVLAPLLLALYATGAFAQAPATITFDGYLVHPIQYGELYYSAVLRDAPPLPDGSHGEMWLFEGAAGDCAEIAMRAAVLDALLVLRYAAPLGDYIAVDDDSFGGSAAIIRKRLPETGPYFITATAAGGGPRAGEYWLRLRQLDSCPALLPGARDE
jgi:hypothetical protein